MVRWYGPILNIFELQRTFDFQRWEPIGEPQRALTATPDESLSATKPIDATSNSYFPSIASAIPLLGVLTAIGGVLASC
jgi:hypothetical protein